MKKVGLVVGLFVASLAFYSCSGGEVNSADTEMNEALNHEADSLEMLDQEIENTTEDLEKSTQEVDNLIKDLEL